MSGLPAPRGELSDAVFTMLTGNGPGSLPVERPAPKSDDFELTLWVLQELRFRRIVGVAAECEDHPLLAALRSELEREQEADLRSRLHQHAIAPEEIPAALLALVAGNEGPSLSRWMEQHGTIDHAREFVMHRAAYQLKEADPHSFAIPRLDAGRTKSALLKIQLDEYGNTEAGQSHAELFADTMRALDVELDLDALPSVTLRTNTVLNTLCATRRNLAATIGHLAVFEMTSVEPMARYAATLRRVLPQGVATDAARFYDVHVAADGFHQKLALDEMVAGFVEQYPAEAAGVLFGASAVMAVEQDFASHLLDAWKAGRSSLARRISVRAA